MFVSLFIEQFRRLPALSKHGYRYLLFGIILTLIINMISDTLGVIVFLLTILSAVMYRDPERAVPEHHENLVLSPVDGVVVAINHVEKGEVMGLAPGGYHVISIWQSFLDVHAIRAPFSGNYQVAAIDAKGTEDLDSSLLLKFTAVTQSLAILIPYSYLFSSMDLPLENKATMVGSKVCWLRLGGFIECYLPVDYKLSIRQGQKLVAAETRLV